MNDVEAPIDESVAMAQVLDRLTLTASKLEEIFRLLQEPGRVEAMVARYEHFIAGRLQATVLDSRAAEPDEE